MSEKKIVDPGTKSGVQSSTCKGPDTTRKVPVLLVESDTSKGLDTTSLGPVTTSVGIDTTSRDPDTTRKCLDIPWGVRYKGSNSTSGGTYATSGIPR